VTGKTLREDDAADAPAESIDADRFVTSILDNLRRAGVQNTKRNERLEFNPLEPYPDASLQRVGEYGEYGEYGSIKRAAAAIGPEFGTDGPELVREAVREAPNTALADVLVVCGFAFDQAVGEQASDLGRLTLIRARMNPDLLVAPV
jgi:adenine-specific DNA-methyltransferase